MCDRHLFGGPLVCVRTDPHETGHTYRADWAPDGVHDDTTAEED